MDVLRPIFAVYYTVYLAYHLVYNGHKRGEKVMHKVTEKLPAIIKRAHQASGMTKAELAERLEISTRHLDRIESGENKPSLNLLGRIVRVLSIPPEIIFYDLASSGSVEEEELNQIISLVKQCGENNLKLLHAIVSAFIDNTSEK